MAVLPVGQKPMAIKFVHRMSQSREQLELQSSTRLQSETHSAPPGAVQVHAHGVSQRLMGSQVAGAGQVPQSSVPPQPSEMDPHSAP